MTLLKGLVPGSKLAKILTLMLFIMLPLLFFCYGIRYQAGIANQQQLTEPKPTSFNSTAINKFNDGIISFHYPQDYLLLVSEGIRTVRKDNHAMGGCVPGGVTIIYPNESTPYETYIVELKGNRGQKQLQNIQKWQVFSEVSGPGKCAGVVRHTAVKKHANDYAVVYYDEGFPHDAVLFNQILSSLQFMRD